ncbi:unnamed protein product [Cuscuta epithymum]|uniref:Uncharacterized protein n=1 Tax=Cuscuta epithymum TaxID=186058 RepID=A0AAV0D498_9ASTE|nr:unnamed protein product [Cuscuta epithymum]
MWTDLLQWIGKIFNTLSKEKSCRFVMLLWGLWKNINDTVWNGNCGSTRGVKCMAEALLMGWQASQEKGRKGVVHVPSQGVVRWTSYRGNLSNLNLKEFTLMLCLFIGFFFYVFGLFSLL